MAISQVRSGGDSCDLAPYRAALCKLLVSIIRADAIVREEEIEKAVEILFFRLNLSRQNCRDLLRETLDQPEYARTLGSCLRDLEEHGETEGLISDLDAVAHADGQYHETEMILVDGLRDMLGAMKNASGRETLRAPLSAVGH